MLEPVLASARRDGPRRLPHGRRRCVWGHLTTIQSVRKGPARMQGLFLPIQLACLIFSHSCLKKVLFLRHVYNFRHPGEGVVYMILALKANALKPSVGNMLHILLDGGWG